LREIVCFVLCAGKEGRRRLPVHFPSKEVQMIDSSQIAKSLPSLQVGLCAQHPTACVQVGDDSILVTLKQEPSGQPRGVVLTITQAPRMPYLERFYQRSVN
jgi:hypothetical protein